MWLHFHASEQHKKKHAEVRDRGEDAIVWQSDKVGERARIARDNRAKRDAGNQLAYQRWLTKAFGELAKGTRRHEKDQKNVKQVHFDRQFSPGIRFTSCKSVSC